MHSKVKLSMMALALAGVMGNAHATILAVDVTVAPVQIVASYFGGTLLDSATTALSNPGWNGIAQTAVYKTASGLDFYYQFSNAADSHSGVHRFTGFDFSSLGASLVNVYQTANGFGSFANGTVASDNADRSHGGVIGFNYLPIGSGDVQPGTTSYIQIIRTNATEYSPGNFVISNGGAGNAVGFATGVPEASNAMMMLSGLGLFGLIGARRLRK
ncbi:hypothetical protein [Methylophilus sp.]|uniref:hypothetical protein n=1 Tax=Methylophilus sp. TaxID=29541 RepID=UPI0040356FDB